MPGSNARALEKAKTLAADVIVMDLEDAVAPDMKDTARAAIGAAVSGGGYGKREIVIRTNGLGTPWIEADIAAAIAAGPDAILVPKVSSAADFVRLAAPHEGHAAPVDHREAPTLRILDATIAVAIAPSGSRKFRARSVRVVSESRGRLVPVERAGRHERSGNPLPKARHLLGDRALVDRAGKCPSHTRIGKWVGATIR